MTIKKTMICDNCREEINPKPSPEGALLWVEFTDVTNQIIAREEPPVREFRYHLCLTCFDLMKQRWKPA